VSTAEPTENAVARAQVLLRLGRPREAAEHLSRALASDPDDAWAHVLMASARLQLEEPEAAGEAAQAAVRLAPENPAGHRLLAVALAALGRKDAAARSAKEAVRLDPEDPTSLLVLSQALQETGDEAGARAAIDQALALDPEDAELHAQLGVILLAHEDADGAERAFLDALELDPESDVAHNNLGVLQMRRRRPMEAMASLEAAARLDPGSELVGRNLERASRGPLIAVLRVVAGFLLVCAVLAAFDTSADDRWGPVIGFAVAGLALLGFARAARPRMSPETAALVADRRRARRYRPARWDWRAPTRLRPWWWIVLTKIPPPAAFAVNLALFVLDVAGGSTFGAVVFGVALPFSGHRLWRWARRRWPGRDSWRPPSD
jgi:Flp pilus assembly protein TadD